MCSTVRLYVRQAWGAMIDNTSDREIIPLTSFIALRSCRSSSSFVLFFLISTRISEHGPGRPLWEENNHKSPYQIHRDGPRHLRLWFRRLLHSATGTRTLQRCFCSMSLAATQIAVESQFRLSCWKCNFAGMPMVSCDPDSARSHVYVAFPLKNRER
jgi:hypothetical protein